MPPAPAPVRLPRPVPCQCTIHMPLMLASTSRYRRELLERLRVPFHIARPDVDETGLDAETVPEMALRLAHAKAIAIAQQHPGTWVIGSDQAAELDGHPLGKPGQREAAIAQLTAMSGRQVRFHTAVCLVRDDRVLQAQDITTVHFRSLTTAEIERYVDADQPFDCAGSFKSEGMGIALFDAIESSDPTALVGLPLIAVSRMLREAGFDLP